MMMPKIVPEYKEEAKRRIVEAGLEVMYDKGYCKTTMDDIAKRLDVTKPALYRYFKNKDELIIESAKILQEQYRRINTPRGPDICPVEVWIETFDQMLSPNLNEHALLFEIFAMTVREPVLREFSVERMKQGIEYPAQAIAKRQEKGQVTEMTDPRTLAIAFVALFNGMRVMYLLGVERDELRSRWIEIIKALFKVRTECHVDCPKYEVCHITAVQNNIEK
ncbi:TetR/AcrR family transcriptional regulator [Methanolacinia petrolearia]|nr:TetR/AcrR family transcriptional regulator [Methanolacinia petrolearia]